MALNRYCLHFLHNLGKLIISALCCEDGRCLGILSMGSTLMSQICPVLRRQTANDYLALGGESSISPFRIR